MDLSKLKRNPKEYNGWNFDYKTISSISQLTQDSQYPIGMEETESVLLALEKYLIMADKNRPLESTKPKALVIHFVICSYLTKTQQKWNKQKWK